MRRVILLGPKQRETARQLCGTVPDGWEAVFREHDPEKSSEQRAYWHILLNTLSDAIGEPVGKLKTTIKVAVLGLDEAQGVDGRVYLSVPSSERRKRKEYMRLIDYTLQFAAEHYGVTLPPPRWTE